MAQPSVTEPARKPAAAHVAPAPKKVGVAPAQMHYLVRTALLTLNDANRSGNYSVLRDLASPTFRDRNTAADLAQAFADLRRRNLDLAAAALLDPEFTHKAEVGAGGELSLKGYFATAPLQIAFDLTFVPVGNEWRVLTLAVGLTPHANRLRPALTD